MLEILATNIDTCLEFKRKLLQLFKAGWITFEDTPNINSNLLPTHAFSSWGVNAVEYGEKKKQVLRVTMDRLYDMLMQVGYLLAKARLSIPFRFTRNDRNIPYQLKKKTKRNKFYLILNLGPFRIFRLNSARNVLVSFHMFRSALEKPLNQIEPCSI